MQEKGNTNLSKQVVAAEDEDYPYVCYVYVLVSTDGRNSYVGWTTNLESRLAAHNSGKGAKSTRGRKWLIVYHEKFRNKSDAMSREWNLKRDRSFRKQLLDKARHELKA